jgi:NitT/TauT family transport system ATP-binding protein
MKLENVKKRYGNKVVLEDITLEIFPGQTTCLMGPSGGGKTTLARLLLGLERPDGGRIVGNEGVKSAVSQEDRLCEGLTAVENVRLVREKGEEADAIALLAALGLSGHEEKPVRELSGGMRRRVAIARALFAEFDLLVLDEAFTGLDEDTKASVLAFVKEKCRGKTTLCITHDADVAKTLGDRLLLLENGRIAEAE